MRRLDTDPDRIDWFRVLADLRRAGLSTIAVGSQLQVPDSTIRGWKMGSEPRHADGESLVDLWMRVLGRQRAQLPKQGR